MKAHFWTPRPGPPSLDSWDPDLEPGAFANGRGHALYELFARLRAKGVDVTIGPSCRRHPDVVVVFAKDLGALDSLQFICRFGKAASLLIESDWPPGLRIPIRATMAATASPGELAPDRRWLPLLPQRGMRTRAADRIGHVRTVGWKGDSAQLPEFLTDAEFLRAVSDLGLSFQTEDARDTRARWHDFSATDVVLCMRRSGLPTEHKPPTKLINAWAAGCIPIVGRESSYLALATDGVDALFADGADELLGALRLLATDSELVVQLETEVAIRRSQYSVERVFKTWQDLIEELATQDPRSRNVLPVGELLYWSRAQVHNVRVRRSAITTSF